MKKKICLLYCYFGKFPREFGLFLESCKYNPQINFIFFTDCQKPKIEYKNVFFYDFDLNKFNQLASEKLKLKVNINHAYKLSDFKPAYGLIFEDFIREYDFWGFGDIDLIFGNISHFMTDEILKNYDIISGLKAYICGSFSLFRNKKEIKNLYKKSADYVKIFQSNQNYCFDECNYAFAFLISGGSIFDIKTDIQSFTHVVKSQEKKGKLRARFKDLISDGGIKFRWKRGELFDLSTGKEILLLHFIRMKGNDGFVFPNWETLPDRFVVNKIGFYKNEKMSGLNFFLWT